MERARNKIDSALSECEHDALLVFGADNLAYLTQCVIPFADHYPDRHAAVLLPRGGSPTMFAPEDWAEAIVEQGWRGKQVVVDENAQDTIVYALSRSIESEGLGRGSIGVDMRRVSYHLIQTLQAAHASLRLAGVDALLERLRIMKTNEEIAHIEAACKQADRGIVYALMHLEGTVNTVGYTVAEFTERIRVHINENGGSGVGLLATASGTDARVFYAPHRGWFEEATLFRMDVSSHHAGYWCNVGRMGVTGTPSREQAAAYRENRILKQSALARLRPGVACRDLHAHVVSEARRMGAALWSEAGVGHGVGASHHEPPYLSRTCATQLAPGMVVALDIYTRGPEGELIHDKDVCVITNDGHRLLSWYRDWDRLYAVTGFRATH